MGSPESTVKSATESAESRLAQGGEPIRAQAYLRYVEHRIGEANAAPSERIGTRIAMQAAASGSGRNTLFPIATSARIRRLPHPRGPVAGGGGRLSGPERPRVEVPVNVLKSLPVFVTVLAVACSSSDSNPQSGPSDCVKRCKAVAAECSLDDSDCATT